MSKRTKELLRENNAWEKKMLSKENQDVMTDIVVYLRSAPISEYEQELVRRDIAMMLAEGQVDERSAEAVLGDDMQAFCDEVIAAMPKLKRGDHVLASIHDLLLGVLVLLVIWVADGVIASLAGTPTLPYLPLTLGDALAGVLILAGAVALFNLISKGSFRMDNKLLYVVIFAVIFVSVILSRWLTQVLVDVHLAAALAIGVAVYLVYKLLERRIDRAIEE